MLPAYSRFDRGPVPAAVTGGGSKHSHADGNAVLESARLCYRPAPVLTAGPCPQPRRVEAAGTAMPTGTRCWNQHGCATGLHPIWPQGRARARNRDGWRQQAQPCRWEHDAGVGTAMLPAHTRFDRGGGPVPAAATGGGSKHSHANGNAVLESARLYFRLTPGMAAGAGTSPQPRRVAAASAAMPTGTRCWNQHGCATGHHPF